MTFLGTLAVVVVIALAGAGLIILCGNALLGGIDDV